MKTGILLTPADMLARWHYMQMAAAHGYTACHHHTHVALRDLALQKRLG